MKSGYTKHCHIVFFPTIKLEWHKKKRGCVSPRGKKETVPPPYSAVVWIPSLRKTKQRGSTMWYGFQKEEKKNYPVVRRHASFGRSFDRLQ